MYIQGSRDVSIEYVTAVRMHACELPTRHMTNFLRMFHKIGGH